MLYSILPLLRLPRTAPDIFTYSSEESLEPGECVRIPFRNKKIFGIVQGKAIREKKHNVYSIKKNLGRIFSKSHIHFFKAVQEESFEHLGTIIQTIYHNVHWNLAPVPQDAGRNGGFEKRKKKLKTQTYVYASPAARLDFFVEHITLSQKLGHSLLIIIPEFADALKMYEEIKNELSKNFPLKVRGNKEGYEDQRAKPVTPLSPVSPPKVFTGDFMAPSLKAAPSYLQSGEETPLFFISSKTPAREYTELFFRSDPCIVLSSRIGIFFPHRFDSIICDDEPNPQYMHEEPAPAYDVRVLAGKRARIFGSKLIYSGYSIRQGTFSRCHSGLDPESKNKQENKKKCHPELVEGSSPSGDLRVHSATPAAFGLDSSGFALRMTKLESPITLISLSDEKRKGNIIFSEPIRILAKKYPLLFILNSRDFAKKITCRACGYAFLCPTCDRPYRAETEYGARCTNCGTREALPPLCPKCLGSNLSFSGMGVRQFTARIERELKSRKKISHAAGIFSDLAALNLAHFRAVVIPFFESFMTANYAATEQLVHSLIKLRKIFSGEILIQHFSDKGPAFLEDLEKTLSDDDAFRASYGYPPYGDVYRIRKKEKIRKHPPTPPPLERGGIKGGVEIIAEIFHTQSDQVLSSTFKKRGLSIHEFIVKLPLNASIDFRKLPQDFHIVKNPVFL